MASFYSLTFEELRTLCQQEGYNSNAPGILYNWHYKQNQNDPCESKRLSQKAKELFLNWFNFDLPNISQIQKDEDKTVKFLLELKDGSQVESVLIPFQNKYTICLSSQVGCAMNCSFCYTGTQGYKRNLQTEEIVGQLLVAKSWLTENRPDDNRLLNVVFMGQGEPLHNFDAVKASAEIFLSQHGLSLADHKITVSTAGYLPGLKRWREEMPAVNIALSFHSPNDEVRSQLIPINRKYPLNEILQTLDEIPLGEKRFITFEYLLVKGVNDSIEDAQKTGELLKDRKAFINLIPFNPFPGSSYERPNQEIMNAFQTELEKFNIPVTLRTTRGSEILAACGQLNTH